MAAPLRLWRTVCFALIAAALVATTPLRAAEALKDTQALQGLKSAKGAFMLDMDSPGKAAHVLEVVAETGKGMAQQGVTPQLVVIFIGPTVAFLTRDRRGISYKDQPAVTRVQKLIKELHGAGVRMEACGVALHGLDIPPQALIPEVAAVGNGFISAIGYQAQGWALVPIY